MRLAAIAGVDPWPLDCRELIAAAEARRDLEWDIGSQITAWVCSAFSGKVIAAEQVHPYREHTPVLDDPGAVYQQLIKRQSRNGKRHF